MKRIEKKGLLTFGLAALAAALVLTGCVTVPPAGIEPSPGAQALSAGLAPDARLTGERMAQHWWTIFGDETLNKVIQDALKKNLDIRTAVARIDEARASLGLVQAESLPSLGMNAGYSRQALSEYDPMALLGAPTEATSAWRLGGAASWELDLWGHVRYRSEAAVERLQSAALQAENVRVSTAAEIARTYLLLRGTEAEIALLEKDLAAQKKRFFGN